MEATAPPANHDGPDDQTRKRGVEIQPNSINFINLQLFHVLRIISSNRV